MPPSALDASAVALALRHSPIPALRRLAVEEAGDAVVITGTVARYYFKQLAQETLMPLLSGRRLVNQVAVVRDGAEAGQ